MIMLECTKVSNYFGFMNFDQLTYSESRSIELERTVHLK